MFNDLQHLYEAMRPLKRLSRTSAMLHKLMYDWKLDSLRSDGQWEKERATAGFLTYGMASFVGYFSGSCSLKEGTSEFANAAILPRSQASSPMFSSQLQQTPHLWTMNQSFHVVSTWPSAFLAVVWDFQASADLANFGIVWNCHILSHSNCKTLSVWIRHAELLPSLSQRTIPKNTAMQLCTHLLLPKNPGIKHPYSVLKCPVSYSCLGAPNSRGVIATLVACTVGLQRLHWKATMLKPPPGICENKLPARAPSVEWPWSAYSQCANYSHYAQKKRKNASLLQQVISLQ